MADAKAESGRPAQSTASPENEWRVVGAEAPEDGDFSDTVVEIPRIPVSPVVAQEQASPDTPTFSRPAPVTAPAQAAAEVRAGAAAVQPVAPAGATSARKPDERRIRKARLRLHRVDPWSMMKISFLFSIAFGIMFWVATWVLWNVVVTSGLLTAINDAIANIVANPTNTGSWRVEDLISTNRVLGIAALLAVVNVILSTALGTLGAFLYNLAATVLGGIEVTLAED